MQRHPLSTLAALGGINPSFNAPAPTSYATTDFMESDAFSTNNDSRKSWQCASNPSALMYNTCETMPFLVDMGIVNPYARKNLVGQQSSSKHVEETAGEPITPSSKTCAHSPTSHFVGHVSTLSSHGILSKSSTGYTIRDDAVSSFERVGCFWRHRLFLQHSRSPCTLQLYIVL